MNNVESPKKIVHSGLWTNLFKSKTEKSEIEALLISNPIFKNFAKKDIENLLSLIHVRNYADDEYVFYEGDPGIGMYIILDGIVLIEKRSNNNLKINLAKLSKGDFFGELALLDDENRTASALAHKEAKIAVIFKPDLEEFIVKYPKKGIMILRGLNQILVTRLRSINQDFISLYLKKS